jgi:cytochrome P450
MAFAASFPTPAVLTYFPETKTRSWRNLGTVGWWRQRDRLIALLDEHIAATRADPGLAERDDVLAMLVRDAGLPSEDLHDDLIALIGAGHETTAAAIAWGAVLLAHHPDVRERARSGDDAYMGALVKEVLRMRPPIPVAAGRVLSEPLEIAGHTVPAGTPVMIDAWGLHHDPEIYPEPERFRPERFLDGAPERYTWLPFGGGAHRCIGASLAELEIKVALGTMLASVDIEPAEAELAPPARRGVTIVPHGGGAIRVGPVPLASAPPKE